MRFGFHISIAGGFSRVVERAKARQCETMQFFSRNPRQWYYKPLDQGDVRRFRSSLALTDIHPVFLHLPYLPNIANGDSDIYLRSIESIVIDLCRAEQLGAQYLIVHIGRRMAASEAEATKAVIQALDEISGRAKNPVMLLLENTAGQGSEVGSTFEEIGRLVDSVCDTERIGVCLDTAHAFEAGYDLSCSDGIERTLESFDRWIGLKRLHLLHLNDSRTPLGSGKDRHWHIGGGYIGLRGFRYLLRHPSLQHLPGIMETPRKDTAEDRKNMRVIQRLLAQDESVRGSR